MPLSARSAILIGQLVINVPVLVTIAACALAARLFGLRPGTGALIGAGIGWVYWSFAVPKWRTWSLKKGADPTELQRLGVATGLLWKKGSVLEKTERRPR